MITCKEYVSSRKEELKQEVSTFVRQPHLVVVQVGSNQASNSYIKSKQRVCDDIGIKMSYCHVEDYQDFSQYDLESLVSDLSNNSNIDGIIVQLPIPEKYNVEEIQNCIIPEKDVDGFRRDSYFEPCTPKGIINYLKANEIGFPGKDVVVVGRSKIVGQPLVNMFIEKGATVTCCNSKTKDVKRYTHEADIVVSAIGQAQFFDDSYFKHGQVIVDVGINRDEDGKLCGDVCMNVEEKAKLMTPVPGGVGILTVVTLAENTVNAYKTQNKQDESLWKGTK